MQDQGKNLLIAVVLALAVFLLWNQFTKKDEPTTASGDKNAPAAVISSSNQKPQIPRVGPQTIDKAATAAAVADVPIMLSFDNLVATFSNRCGGLAAWRLTDKRYDRDATRGSLLPTRDIIEKALAKDAKDAKAGAPAGGVGDLPACGGFDINFVTSSSTFFIPRGAEWKGEKVPNTNNQVRYRYTDDKLDIEKLFTVIPDKYLVSMELTITAHVAAGAVATQQLAFNAYAYQDPEALKEGSSRVAARAWSSSTMRKGETVQTDVNGVIEWPRYEPSAESTAPTLQWTGFEHPYLLVGYSPNQRPGERVEKHTDASDGSNGLPRGFMHTEMVFQPVTFKSDSAPYKQTIAGYLGPKNYDDLEQADAAAGFSTGFKTVVDLGWFGFIGHPLLWLLQKIHEFIGNWGIAIVLLTIVVKLATLYWTTKSMRSMKAMGALAPQMKALQEKYGDDKQRQQAETMALYKEHGVNPVAGCLPMLLQMPIWLALYRMLSSAGELYQQPFIPGWIDDLTATDPVYVLPAILFITMFVQARLQPASVDSTQQKFMQYGMPIMFGVMSFFFPSGLTLYMLTNTVLGAVHSVYMNKFDKKSLAIAAQLQKNKDAAEAAKTATNAKPSGSSSAKAGPAKAKPAAKPVIQVKATEVITETATERDDTDDADDEPAVPGDAPAASASSPGAPRNRPRRKKRKR